MRLMFEVGLHFSIEALLTVRKIAVPGAVIQFIARTLNPKIEAVPRRHHDAEAQLLRRKQLGRVLIGEHQLALVWGMAIIVIGWQGKA